MCSMSWRRASAASSPAREGRTASCAEAGSAPKNVETSKKKPNRLPRGQTERTIRLIKITCSSQKDRPAKGGATALPSRPQIDANLAKKRKSVAQSKLRTTTYVEVSACNRFDSGRYKFSNVRGADSQGNG